MTTLQVFDRPMCCSSGVCGPKVDPVLPRFAADLDWLKAQGVTVERYNLAQQPAAFTAHADVHELLARYALKCLPITRINDRVVCKGAYPSREMLAQWCGVASSQRPPVPDVRCCGPTGCC